MSKPVVASYCTTFLKPEMMHIYRQVTGLQRVETFVVCRERRCEEQFPFPDVRQVRPRRSNFVRRFWLKYVRREPPIVYRGEYGAIARLLEAGRTDLLHVYFGHTGVHLLPFIRRWPGPVVCSFHGMDVQPRREQPGYEERLRELLHELPLVMARSQSLQRRLEDLGCDPAKIHINRTGIPMDRFPRVERTRPPEGGAWQLVQACRLIEKKGLDTALRAFAEVLARGHDARFTIAGEGPLEGRLRRLVDELGLGDRVQLVGFLAESELADLYGRSHVFVHPSQLTDDQNQEGVPNSMLEAMATGLPVVATLHGGIPEAVEEGRSGLLVPERDAGALADAMERMIVEQGLWERTGQAAAVDVRERFDQQQQIARLEDCYFEVLAKDRPG